MRQSRKRSYPRAHFASAARILAVPRDKAGVVIDEPDFESVAYHEYHKPGKAFHVDPGHAKRPGRAGMVEANKRARRGREGNARYFDKLTFGNAAWDLPVERVRGDA